MAHVWWWSLLFRAQNYSGYICCCSLGCHFRAAVPVVERCLWFDAPALSVHAWGGGASQPRSFCCAGEGPEISRTSCLGGSSAGLSQPRPPPQDL
eukprot:5291718-Amphidinium_carterae.1